MSSQQQHEPLAFLGIGNMGAAIVLALLKGPHPVTIWNRTADRPLVKQCTAAGAVLMPTVAAAIEKSTTILTNLLDYESIKTSLASLPEGALAGKTFINIANGTPAEAAHMKTHLLARGVRHYVDGAIMVTPTMVGGPDSFLVIAGEDAAFVDSVVAPVLAPVGRSAYMGPEIGAASRYDVAALATMYGMFSGGWLAMALLKKGTPGCKGKVAPLVESSIVPMITALVPLVAELARDWDEETFEESNGSPLGMQLQGIRKIIESAKDDGIDAGMLEHLAGLMERVIKDKGSDGNAGRVGAYLMQ